MLLCGTNDFFWKVKPQVGVYGGQTRGTIERQRGCLLGFVIITEAGREAGALNSVSFFWALKAGAGFLIAPYAGFIWWLSWVEWTLGRDAFIFSYLTRLLIFTLEASITIMTIIPGQRGSYFGTGAAAIATTKAPLRLRAWRARGEVPHVLLCRTLSDLGWRACWEVILLFLGEEMEFLKEQCLWS